MQGDERLAGRPWLAGCIRALVCLVLFAGIYFSVSAALAEWNFRKGTIDGMRAALRWNTRNPRYAAELAKLLRNSPQLSDAVEASALADSAVRLGPHSAKYWADVAANYESLGRRDAAQKALERASELFPNSPDINWKLGNFYLRAGRTVDGLRALKKTVTGDAEMRWAAFDVAFRASGDASQVAAEMLPGDTEAVCQFLRYLVAEKQMHGADETWRHLLSLNAPIDPKLTYPYLDALIQRREVSKLATAWSELTRRSGLLSRRAALYSNVLFNGDFEGEILNGGLDWRVAPLAGAKESLDSIVFFDGTHSLRVQFDGSKNWNYEQVYQFVPVQPNSHYRFSGYVRTKDITTDSGVRFQIYDAYHPGRLLLMTNSITGTVNWSPQLLEFTTGPDTILLLVRIVRLPSQKLDNRIQGTAWIDHVTLNLVQ